MKVKVDSSVSKDTKGKPDRKRPKSGKYLSDWESERPPKIGRASGADQPSEEKENAPTNAMKLSDINKAVFGVFKKIQTTSLSQKIINALIVLLRDDTNTQQRSATCAYVLKRFVRSTGADDIESVSLAASYIHCILSSVPGVDALEVLAIMRKDLAVGQQRGKEDTLAAVGQMVTAYAILKTPQFEENPDPKLVAAFYEILVSQLKGREYLMSMCTEIMASSFKKLPVKLFEEHVWPLLQSHLNKPLSALKVNTCDILLSIHLAYPSVLGREQLLSSLWANKPQYEELFELYFAGSTIHNEGVYEHLAKFIAYGGKEVVAALQKFIEGKQPIKFNAGKAFVIQVIGRIFHYYQDEDQQAIVDLFTPTTIKFLLQETSNVKNEKGEVKKPSQLELREAILRFEGSLIMGFKIFLKEENKLQLFQKFLDEKIQVDWMINVPRFSHHVINGMAPESCKTMYQFYLNKLVNLSDEDRFMGTYCLNQLNFILQNSDLAEKESKWRNKQLRNMMIAGLFHLDGNLEPCFASEASPFSRQCSGRCEEIFLSLQLHKCPNLPALVRLLRKNIVFLNKKLALEDAENKLLFKRDKALQKSWPKVEKLLAEPSDESDEVAQSFEALIYFVAIALCTKSTLPFMVLDDLIICRRKALNKSDESDDDQEDEDDLKDRPEWQAVLTDALLQMLLQTGHFWRELVNMVVSSVIRQLRNNNLEQILEVLNMNKNPLSKNDEDYSSDDDSDEDSSSEDEEGEERDYNDKEDGDETYLAQIRESVRQALLGEGHVDDDGSSVDWNDVDEAQGQRLNAALERSFQLLKPKSAKAQAKQGPTKSERIDLTSLLHFRIRALDLLELFTTQKPTQTVILDVLLCSFQVFRYSTNDSKQKSLTEASLKLLKKVLATKIDFENNPDKAPILDAIEQLLTTGEEKVDDDNENKEQVSRKSKADITAWRDKCFAYLVHQGSVDEDPKKSAVWPQLVKLLDLWVANRNTILSLGSFEALFQAGQWAGAAPLAVLLASHLDLNKTRSLRRAQILKLFVGQSRRLDGAFKNVDSKDAKEFNQQLVRYITQLEESDRYSAKELKLLQKVVALAGKNSAQLLKKVKIAAQKLQGKKVNEAKTEEDKEDEDELEHLEVEEPKSKKRSPKKNKKVNVEIEDELMDVDEDEDSEEDKATKAQMEEDLEEEEILDEDDEEEAQVDEDDEEEDVDTDDDDEEEVDVDTDEDDEEEDDN